MKNHTKPTPFCYNPKQVKAIVLGADPSNFSDKGNRKILTKAFGIGDGDARYFQGILKNLKAIGLGLEDIYVDNLIQDYLESETSKNKYWFNVAEKNIPKLLKRLNRIDKMRRVPVLITAEISTIPIPSNNNKILRPLIPFYRNKNYALSQQTVYKKRIQSLLNDGIDL
jgi:hypothetical protein